MNSLKAVPLTWIIVSVVCSSLAHFALKMGATNLRLEGPPVAVALNLATNGWLILGGLLHVAALGLWVTGLRWVDLSVAYPFIALGLVLVGLLSWLWLNEGFNPVKLAGTALVVVGVVTIARS